METRPVFLCEYCGLETLEVSEHLRRAHGLTLTEWLARASARDLERQRREAWAAAVSNMRAE